MRRSWTGGCPGPAVSGRTAALCGSGGSSRRLYKAVRRATALSVLGSVAGTLLSFYMVFQGAYNLLTPLALLVFLLLWTLPVLLLADWAGRY